MRIVLCLMLVMVTALTGCAMLTGGSGADVATRILAGLDCVAALAQIGAPLAVDPDLGVATATDAFNAVQKITDASKQALANNACAATLAYAVQDMKGAIAMVQNKVATPTEPAPQRKARLSSSLPKAQAAPVVVQIPLK